MRNTIWIITVLCVYGLLFYLASINSDFFESWLLWFLGLSVVGLIVVGFLLFYKKDTAEKEQERQEKKDIREWSKSL